MVVNQIYQDLEEVQINLKDLEEVQVSSKGLEGAQKVIIGPLVGVLSLRVQLVPTVAQWSFNPQNSYKRALVARPIWQKASEHTKSRNNSLLRSTVTTLEINSKPWDDPPLTLSPVTQFIVEDHLQGGNLTRLTFMENLLVTELWTMTMTNFWGSN